MCELYDMNELYLKLFKKISTARKIMTIGMKGLQLHVSLNTALLK